MPGTNGDRAWHGADRFNHARGRVPGSRWVRTWWFLQNARSWARDEQFLLARDSGTLPRARHVDGRGLGANREGQTCPNPRLACSPWVRSTSCLARGNASARARHERGSLPAGDNFTPDTRARPNGELGRVRAWHGEDIFSIPSGSCQARD